MKSKWRRLARAACSRSVRISALKTSIVVGTILNALNHGRALWHHPSDVISMQVVVNYLVPFCVSAWSGAAAIVSHEDAAPPQP